MKVVNETALPVKDVDDALFGDKRFRINVGMSTCGLAAGANPVFKAFDERLKETGLKAKLVNVGCIGACYAEPLVEFVGRDKPGVIYRNVSPQEAPGLIESYLEGDVSNAFALRRRDGLYANEESVPLLEELDFFRHQVRDALENCGVVDPESIDEYVIAGGYSGLKKALTEMTPAEVIEEVTAAGLRGRGGAGFPTGLKWRFTRQEQSEKKYVICNADEGDPGAFMNRLNAEGDPHKVLEGLMVSAYAVGADEAYIFVRAEKPLMAERMQKAVDAAYERGLLGWDVLGSGFRLDVHVSLSAGAFVCGEETALMEAIEGKRAMPRPRPPFPSTRGLWGKPTCINNVETLAHIPNILIHGAERFASVGNENSKGTKVFCLTGSVQRSGAVEVPMGTSLRTLIYQIGGGPKEGRSFKAVQTGGPSGGCLSSDHIDLALDYESLQAVGSIMGSGGIVVMDDSTCIVDVAKFFLSFTNAESCGKCTPCRIGLKRMKDVYEQIILGQGRIEHLDMLERVSKAVVDSSLCALGRSAPNPILTTMRYFKEEYLSHIVERRCPAGVCKALGRKFEVITESCSGRSACEDRCPTGAITIRDSKAHINQDVCIGCGLCAQVCPTGSIREVI